MVTVDDVRGFLLQRGVSFDEVVIPQGISFRCTPGGEIINVSTKGKPWFQGKSQTPLALAVREFAGLPLPEDSVATSPKETSAQPVKAKAAGELDRAIFIVYGHDISARNELELLLHRMDLEPIVLDNLPAGGDTIIEKLDKYLGGKGNVGFACVLLTPDDEGYVKGKTEQKKYRARQNVVLELGMVLANLGRKRVVILHKQSVEIPSDIQGLIYVPFDESVDEVKDKLHRELKNAGYNPKV